MFQDWQRRILDFVNHVAERRCIRERLKDITLVTEGEVGGGFENDVLFGLCITATT